MLVLIQRSSKVGTLVLELGSLLHLLPTYSREGFVIPLGLDKEGQSVVGT